MSAKCPICGKGDLLKVNDIILEISGHVFVVEGERCAARDEEIPYEKETKKVVDAFRKLGIWPEPLKLEKPERQRARSENSK